MATTHYSFPTINGTDTIDGVNAINGLANAVDTALYQVEQEGGSTPGANSINTSMIQNGAVTNEKLSNGAVTNEKLDSTVQNNIAQGTQAYTAVNANPTQVANTGGVRVYAKNGLVTVVMAISNRSWNQGANDITTISQQYRPVSQTGGAATFDNGSTRGYGFVTADGRVGIMVDGNPGSSGCTCSFAYYAGY